MKYCSHFVISILFLSSVCFASEQTLPVMAQAFKAPEFDLRGEDGKRYRLIDFRGQVVVLNFWATWCPPCRFEMPAMERAWQSLRNQGVTFLAINVGEDEDTIFEFFANYPVTFPIPMDRQSQVIEQYGVIGLPTTFVINPAGMVTHRTVGTREWDDAGIQKALLNMRKLDTQSASP